MAIAINNKLKTADLNEPITRMFEHSGEKIRSLQHAWKSAKGTPVFTVKGKYTSRGWTEWTQGFQVGSALLQFDATGEEEFLELGRRQTIELMASHVSHIGVHDHGFNNVSTYGNLLRLAQEGKTEESEEAQEFYKLALKTSGAVQAARWTQLNENEGYVYSFNGPHSLFIDTIRSMRALGVAHQLKHVLMGEQDAKISLLDRLLTHAKTTAKYGVYYGEGRDAYDVRGRTAHESIFNVKNGSYRCPSSQQGYSPFSTWTRGLAWALCGFAELLEFTGNDELKKPAEATADFYIEHSCTDGVPMWDTGAPNLHRMPDHLDKPSDPYNRWEPVDSSAAAIAALGLLRLGKHLGKKKYLQAGLTVTKTLLSEPYLSTKTSHQGLLLHSVYHRPNGWDHIAPGQKVPNGESSMWGDYHLRELGLLLLKQIRGEPYLTFFLK